MTHQTAEDEDNEAVCSDGYPEHDNKDNLQRAGWDSVGMSAVWRRGLGARRGGGVLMTRQSTTLQENHLEVTNPTDEGCR